MARVQGQLSKHLKGRSGPRVVKLFPSETNQAGAKIILAGRSFGTPRWSRFSLRQPGAKIILAGGKIILAGGQITRPIEIQKGIILIHRLTNTNKIQIQ